MLGKFRGKVGAMVFRTEAGIGQIASEYNPNPKNPRTIAQTRQRSKMNLAGQLSKLTPAPIIAGLSSNGRTARSMFVSNLIKACVMSGENDLTATINMAAVKYSKGASYNVSATPYYDVEEGQFSFSISQSFAAEQVIGCLYIWVNEDSAAPAGNNIVVGYGVKMRTDVNQEVLVTSGFTPSATNKLHVYLVPIIETESGVTLSSGEIEPTSTGYTATVLRSIAAAGGYGNSVYCGSIASGN